MKMKQFVVTIFALALTLNVTAQSLEEGQKMYRYERYASAKKILQPLAAGNAEANYYYGLSELALGNVDQAIAAFVKYPEDYANIGGTVRAKFVKEGEAAGMQAAKALAESGKRKDIAPKRYAAEAVTYSKGGDKQQAVNWYNEVMEKLVTSELLVAVGDAYLAMPSGGGKAMTSFEKAVEKNASNSLAYSRMGKLMYDAKNYEKALEHWGKAKEADPANPIPYYDMANAYTYVGKYEVAKENMEEYMKRSDNSVEDRIRYAEILYQSKDYTNAIEKIKQLQSEGVNRDNFYGILGYSYLESKDSVDKVRALENTLKYFEKQDPKKIYSLDHIKLGQAYLANNKVAEANASFDKALQTDQSDDKIDVYRDIAEAFRQYREWGSAGNWYKRIYKDFPSTASATDYFWGGYSYYVSSTTAEDKAAEMLQEADNIYATMIEKYADQPSGYYWRGRVNASMDSEGDKCLAEPYFKQWLDMDVEGGKKSDKDLQVAYQYLCLCKYKASAFDDAIMYSDKVLALDPDNAFAEQIKDLSEKAKK